VRELNAPYRPRSARPEATPGVANARALAWSLLIHALALGLLFVGLKWSESEQPLSVKGPIIEASLVIDPAAEPLPPAPPKPRPAPPKPKPAPPKPEPKPEPQSPAPPEEEPDPAPTPERAEDPRDQQLIDELGLREAEDEAREQEELVLRQQIELEEEERREREQREREREEQLDDFERDRREEEERRMDELLEQERAEQDAQPAPGNEGDSQELRAQYSMALSQVIERNWTRPDTVPLGMKCRIVIIQAPGGEVVGAKVDPACPYDEIGKRSLEAAVGRASPLPYEGFEDVFNERLNLTFTPDDRY